MKPASRRPHRPGTPGPARILWRSVRRRCPNCGAGGLFSRWVVMRPACPGCHLRLDRGEPDYFIGSYTINFVTAELVIVVGALIGAILTWPDVPWNTIKWSLLILMVPTPVFFLPFARTLWLGVDLLFRPLTRSDLVGHGENLPPGTEPPPGDANPSR